VQLSPNFGLRFPPISDSSFTLHFGLLPLKGESFVKGVVCPVKLGGSKKYGEVLIYNLIKAFLPYFSLGTSCAHQV